MTEAPPAPEVSQEWLKILTEGHRPLRVMRWVFRFMPSPPRCKMCSNPFGGLGGKAVGLVGFKRSRKNPNLCSACCDKLPPGGAEIDIAVLFADVRASVQLGASMPPAAFAGLMNGFYRTATEVLVKHDAIIDKLVGDEVMALFIPGIAGKRYRALAVEAGRALMKELSPGDDTARLGVGVAVHAGTAYVGNVGGQGVVDFTALGDTVNTAARLQSAAAPGELVISDSLWESLEGVEPEAELRMLDLKGKEAGFRARVARV